MKDEKKKGIEVNEILSLNDLKIEKVINTKWTTNLILHPRPQRPGLALTGYFKYLSNDRLQVLGKTEMGYLLNLKTDEWRTRIKNYLSLHMPAIIVSENQEPGDEFYDLASRYRTPVLISSLRTSLLISRISTFLYQYFSQKIKINGVLLDIMGQGVMITGSSGIGKSETALELVNKGYSLIADDLIEFYKDPNDDLIGRSSEKTKNWMEVRGLGIINIYQIFGASAILSEKKLDLVIELEKWDPKKSYDRLGEDFQYYKLLGNDLPKINLPVASGRNVSTIIEVAVRYFISRKNGAKTFLEVQEENEKQQTKDEG